PRPALRLAAAAPVGGGDGPHGLRRGDRRLGDDRGRAPALHRVRTAAHGAFRLAVGRTHRRRVAPRLRRRLLRRLRRGRRLHAEAHGPDARAGRRGADRRPAGAKPRPGPGPDPVPRSAEPDLPRQGGRPMNLTFDLPTAWAFILAFAVFAYVILDG